MVDENNPKQEVLHRATEFSVWNAEKKEKEDSNVELVVIKEGDRKETGENGETKYLSYGIKLKDGKWLNGFMNKVEFDDNPDLKLLNPKEDENNVNVGFEIKPTKKDANKTYKRIYVRFDGGNFHSSFVNE